MPFHPSAVGDYPKSAELMRRFIEQHDGCQWHGIDLDRCVLFVSERRLVEQGTNCHPAMYCRERETIPATWASVRRWLGY